MRRSAPSALALLALAVAAPAAANPPSRAAQRCITPMVVKDPGTMMLEPNHWQPLALDVIITQNGIELPDKVQTYIGSHWGNVRPFALGGLDRQEFDLGGPPQLATVAPPRPSVTDGEFKDLHVELIEQSSELDPSDGVTMDISPGMHGNNPLGTTDGTGHATNPVTGQPYAPNVVKRGDWGRVIAEFWADGPSSETPPGHWNTIANYVSDRPLGAKRLGGTGPVLDGLEWT